MNNRKDEVDLLEVLLKSINVFRTNFWTIVIFFLVGCLLGFTYYSLSPPFYENKLIISSSILTESYGKKFIENTRNFIRENNTKALAAQLSLTEAEAKKIRIIRIENLSELQADILKENERFLITVQVTDQEILPKLQQGLINYFENNEFVKVRVQQSKNYLRQMIAKMEEEIKDLEELKARIHSGDFFQSTRGNVSFDPTSVNSKILEIMEKKINLQNSLELSNSVQVIEGFTRYEKPVSPKLILSLIGGSTVGLLFSGCYIMFKLVRKILKKAESVSERA
jgi:hypothetical protein